MCKILDNVAAVLLILFIIFVFYVIVTEEGVRYVWRSPTGVTSVEMPIKQNGSEYHDITFTYRWYRDGRIVIIDSKLEPKKEDTFTSGIICTHPIDYGYQNLNLKEYDHFPIGKRSFDLDIKEGVR